MGRLDRHFVQLQTHQCWSTTESPIDNLWHSFDFRAIWESILLSLDVLVMYWWGCIFTHLILLLQEALWGYGMGLTIIIYMLRPRDPCYSTPESLRSDLGLQAKLGKCIPLIGYEWCDEGNFSAFIVSYGCRMTWWVWIMADHNPIQLSVQHLILPYCTSE